MLEKLKTFLARHPLLRDSLLWGVPALLLGAFLRLCLLHYSPYAYWGSDSRSYYEFTYKLFTEHYFSLNEKRRFLYPLFLALVSILPGPPLRWIAVVQHALGLLTLLPLAYVMRKNFICWRWWIIPITVLYAGLPVVLWYEHELLGENLFFASLVWAVAGWSAWAREPQRARAIRLWWAFYIPFACFILTKPSGRFYWPGLLLGLLALRAWRRLSWVNLGALGALMLATLVVGSRTQGSWLFYVASFPLTQLDTPAHAEYKAEIRDLVQPLHDQLDTYYANDDIPFNFLENPGRHPERKLWAPLAKDDKTRSALYLSLALEGVKAEPGQFLYLGLQRAVFSSNLSNFKKERFLPDYMPRRFTDDYAEAVRRQGLGNPTPLPMVLGLPQDRPLPPYEAVKPRFSPAADSFAAAFLKRWIYAWDPAADLVSVPAKGSIKEAHLTFLGWWLVVSLALAFTPRYRATLGIWSLAALSYVSGVFLVSQVNPRYFGAVWPVFLPLLAVAADFLVALLRSRRPSPAPAPALQA